MAKIQIFEINENGELLVNDPELAGVLQELKPEELKITGGCVHHNHAAGCGVKQK
ncbi:type A2 lantipeptide [Dolichospermum circinale]|uniref:type A2 lantipeptide n=1 Tax=Dolichospermum circinale TaxID=109265 RepID=UPI00232D5529|nr:type A2 lantipeptide [Dolichospermum circinale]MDB9456454.1 type A2 lantipeptide [Dolichospermum circinale CS-541/06]MDB9461027.1 type A2 lantipeptide [Dolichospermum circinale CS-541/04]MDB9547903.1 type A2 lantipeptide [Dolichospermum circinale CS-1031]